MNINLNICGELAPHETLNGALSRLFNGPALVDGSTPSGSLVEDLQCRLEEAEKYITVLRAEKEALISSLELAKNGLEAAGKELEKAGKSKSPKVKKETAPLDTESAENAQSEDTVIAAAETSQKTEASPAESPTQEEKPVTLEELRAIAKPIVDAPKDKMFEGKTYLDYAKEKLAEIGIDSIAKTPKTKLAETKALLLQLREILI